MKYFLIDTHVFLWLAFDPSRIEEKKLALLSDPKNRVCVSNITFWEISLKYQLGKLGLEGVCPNQLPPLAEKMGLEIIDVAADVMASFYQLSLVEGHKDPFDRMIIWQCICDGATLISKDRKFSEYKVHGLSVG